MGRYTFADFKSALKFNLGNREDLDNYLGNWVNQAYIDFTTQNRFFGFKIPRFFDFPELMTSTAVYAVAGTPYINTPVDCLYVQTVWDSTNDLKLTHIPFQEYTRKTGRENSSAMSKPRYWVRSGSYIWLYPTPDGAYDLVVYYRKRPAQMVNDTDTTEIGEEWDEPIVMLATIYGSKRLRDFETAKEWQLLFLDNVASKMNIYSREERDMREFLRPDLVYKKTNEY